MAKNGPAAVKTQVITVDVLIVGGGPAALGLL